MKGAARVYRWAMRLLWSRHLRQRHGDHATALFEQLHRDARRDGLRASGGLWLRSIGGLIETSWAERGDRRASDPGRGGWWLGLGADLVAGGRHLRQRPLAGAVVVLSLALGLGVNAATFSVFRAVQLARLPVRDADRLVSITMDNPVRDLKGWSWSYPNIRDLRATTEQFVEFGVYGGYSANLMAPEGPVRVAGARISAGFLRALGVDPVLGREFSADEDRLGGPSVALIGYELWQREFSGADTVLEATVTLDGVPYGVVGVLPPGYRFVDRLLDQSPNTTSAPASAQVFVPLEPEAHARRRSTSGYGVIARMAERVTAATADAEVRALMERLQSEYAEEFCCDWIGRATPLQERIVGRTGPALALAFAAASAVLALVCVNLGSLLTVRASERAREWAVRRSLGARPARLARQVLGECLALGAAGGVLGLGLGAAILRGFLAIAPASLPRVDEIALGLPAAGFVMVASLLAAVGFGAAPALLAARRDPADALRERQVGLSPRGARLLRSLVGIEVGLALALVLASALLVQSLGNLGSQDPGYLVDDVIAAALRLPSGRYVDDEAVRGFVAELTPRLESTAGIAAAGLASFAYPAGPYTRMQIEGRTASDGQPASFSAPEIAVSPGFFDTMGLRMISGRGFSTADDAAAVPVVVVSEALAAQNWPQEDPLGKRVIMGSWRPFLRGGGSTPAVAREVIGVVSDVRVLGMDGGGPLPYIYMPLAQDPWISLFAFLRTERDPATAVGSLRTAVASLDAELPVFGVESVAATAARQSAHERFVTTLVAGFAALALALAAVGIYGTVAYSVALRAREIGLRKALGATPPRVARKLLWAALPPTIVGTIGGLIGFAIVGGWLESLLYEVTPMDARVLAPASLALLLLALVATWLPARRAARLDPVAALRDG